LFPTLTEPWNDILTSAVIVAAAVMLAIAAKWLLDNVVRRLVKKTSTGFDDAIVESLAGPLRTLIIVIGLDMAVSRLNLVPADWRSAIDRTIFILYLFVAYLALFRLISAIGRWYGREVVLRTETDLDDKFLTFFQRTAQIVLTLILLIMLLSEFGIEPAALVTTLGVGSLAFAFAAQGTLSDIIAGFMILIDQPFKVGDRIEVLDISTWGDVTGIGLRSTRIRTRDNRMVAVPNSVIGKGLVVNYSVPDTVYRVETHVGIAYGSDVEMARKVMVDAVASEDWVMVDQPIEALLLEFGDSALIFRVRCWIEHYIDTRRIIDQLNSALYEALNREQIIIPFPRRDVRLVSSVSPEEMILPGSVENQGT